MQQQHEKCQQCAHLQEIGATVISHDDVISRTDEMVIDNEIVHFSCFLVARNGISNGVYLRARVRGG